MDRFGAWGVGGELAEAGVEADGGVVVVVDDRGEFAQDRDFDPKLLAELADHAFIHGFSRIEFAPRQLPVPPIYGVVGALGDQDLVLA